MSEYVYRNKSAAASSEAAKAPVRAPVQRLRDDRPSALPASSPVIQRVTSVKLTTQDYRWGPNAGDTERVGHKMTAVVDPKYPENGSSPGGTALKKTMDAFHAMNYRGMIKGHLMNGQLGGPGIAANLFPITSKANTEHKLEVENIVKSLIKNNVTVRYDVTATYSTPVGDAGPGVDPDGTFSCVVKNDDDGTSYLEKDIESRPHKSKTGLGWAQAIGILTYNQVRKAVKNADLPKGWGEKGSGRADRDWSHVKEQG